MRIPSAEQRNILTEKIEEYHANIGPAEEYLAGRGIYRAAIDRFKLGFDGTRLAIPYLTPAGSWQIKRRCIADHDCKEHRHGKYIYDDGAELHLYNAQTLLHADRVVITEGELDAVAVEMAGVPAVAYPGVESWKRNRHWRWCFDSASEVVVVADGDEPREGKEIGVGEEAARAVADSLRSSLPDLDVRVVVMPVGFDSNRFIHERGDIEFLEEVGLI